jgi:hypothetical protein
MPEASGFDENELIAEEKAEPFCSRVTRWEVGVDGLKNATQLAVIWATGVPVPVGGLPGEALPEAPAEALAAGADDDVAAGAVVDEELPLLEQAVAVSAATMAPAIARPFAG